MGVTDVNNQLARLSADSTDLSQRLRRKKRELAEVYADSLCKIAAAEERAKRPRAGKDNQKGQGGSHAVEAARRAVERQRQAAAAQIRAGVRALRQHQLQRAELARRNARGDGVVRVSRSSARPGRVQRIQDLSPADRDILARLAAHGACGPAPPARPLPSARSDEPRATPSVGRRAHGRASLAHLPTEILELIFLHSHNLDLPLVSRAVYFKLAASSSSPRAVSPLAGRGLHLKMLHYLSVPLQGYEPATDVDDDDDAGVFGEFLKSADHHDKQPEGTAKEKRRLRVASSTLLARRFVTAELLAMAGIKYFVRTPETAARASSPATTIALPEISAERARELPAQALEIPQALLARTVKSPAGSSSSRAATVDPRRLAILIYLLQFKAYTKVLRVAVAGSLDAVDGVAEQPAAVADEEQDEDNATQQIEQEDAPSTTPPRQRAANADGTLNLAQIPAPSARELHENVCSAVLLALIAARDFGRLASVSKYAFHVVRRRPRAPDAERVEETENAEQTDGDVKTATFRLLAASAPVLVAALDTRDTRVISAVLGMADQDAKNSDLVWEHILRHKNPAVRKLVLDAGGRPSLHAISSQTRV